MKTPNFEFPLSDVSFCPEHLFEIALRAPVNPHLRRLPVLLLLLLMYFLVTRIMVSCIQEHSVVLLKSVLICSSLNQTSWWIITCFVAFLLSPSSVSRSTCAYIHVSVSLCLALWYNYQQTLGEERCDSEWHFSLSLYSTHISPSLYLGLMTGITG